jgi:hypothetical protein
MAFTEGQPGRDILSHSEVARIIAVTENKYSFKQYLPADIDAGLNLPTALAAMHAIDAKGSEKGWETQDLLAALPVTRAALTAAGFANAKEGLRALLAGTTGKLSEIMEKILPQDAPKGVKAIAGAIVRTNTIDNMRVVAGLLIDEKKLERRLLKLVRIQQDMVLNPGKTRALLAILNGKYGGFGTLPGSGLPQDVATYLGNRSPFSLEDMNELNGLFNAVIAGRNSAIQIEKHRVHVETELKRLDAAGANIARVVTKGTESVVKNSLLFVGGAAGGVGGGVISAGDEMVYQIKESIESVKRKNAQRKASKIQ